MCLWHLRLWHRRPVAHFCRIYRAYLVHRFLFFVKSCVQLSKAVLVQCASPLGFSSLALLCISTHEALNVCGSYSIRRCHQSAARFLVLLNAQSPFFESGRVSFQHASSWGRIQLFNFVCRAFKIIYGRFFRAIFPSTRSAYVLCDILPILYFDAFFWNAQELLFRGSQVNSNLPPSFIMIALYNNENKS